MRRVMVLTAMLMAAACRKDATEERLTEEAKVGSQNPGNDDGDADPQATQDAPSTAPARSSARSGKVSTTDHPDAKHTRRTRDNSSYFGADERSANQVIDSTNGRDTGVFRQTR